MVHSSCYCPALHVLICTKAFLANFQICGNTMSPDQRLCLPSWGPAVWLLYCMLTKFGTSRGSEKLSYMMVIEFVLWKRNKLVVDKTNRMSTGEFPYVPHPWARIMNGTPRTRTVTTLHYTCSQHTRWQYSLLCWQHACACALKPAIWGSIDIRSQTNILFVSYHQMRCMCAL